MENSLSTLAIKYALTQNWKEAIKTNQTILENQENSVDALNRLAFAYLKCGNINLSKQTYKKVLKIDKYNPIALKNLKWLSSINKTDIHAEIKDSPAPTVFLEEPGKTKIVTLFHTAPTRVLCNIISAQKVFLIAKKRAVEIRSTKETYIGVLPDDLSFRLIKLISGGNTYDAYIKNVSKNNVSIFIRELKKGKRFKNVPSFPLNKSQYNSISKSHNSEDNESIS